MNTKEWRALIRKLRKWFPVQAPVSVVRRPTRGLGLTTFDGRSYRVRVSSSQPYDAQVDTLLHEWAHVCAIEEAYGHRGRWATLHGEIYHAWEQSLNDVKDE